MALYEFDWDPVKERRNIRKHNVSFRLAATIFRDPNLISLFDEEHSESEERWISIGIDGVGVLRVVVHTLDQVEEELWKIRIISARKATASEASQYMTMRK